MCICTTTSLHHSFISLQRRILACSFIDLPPIHLDDTPGTGRHTPHNKMMVRLLDCLAVRWSAIML